MESTMRELPDTTLESPTSPEPSSTTQYRDSTCSDANESGTRWQPSNFSFPPRPHNDDEVEEDAISFPSPSSNFNAMLQSSPKSKSSSFSSTASASSSASSSPPSSVHSTTFPCASATNGKSTLHADAPPFVFNPTPSSAVKPVLSKNAFSASALPPPVPRILPLQTPPGEGAGRVASFFPSSTAYPPPKNSSAPQYSLVQPGRPSLPQAPFGSSSSGATNSHFAPYHQGNYGGGGGVEYEYNYQRHQYPQHPPTPPSSNLSRSSSPSRGAGYFNQHHHSRSSSGVGLGISGVDFGSPLNINTGTSHPQTNHHNRSPTAAELQAYFGPSSVPVNLPAFTPISSSSSSTSSSSSPITTTSTELYAQARHNFVTTSLVSLPPTTPDQQMINEKAMGEHFDRAMASNEPLSVLFGLSIEMGRTLLDDDGRGSGVEESVLRCARERMGLTGPRGEGPSSNNRKLGLYKTELCRSWEEKGSCRYGTKCQFAHGSHEIRDVARHPKFKSEVCRTFWLHGSCPYGRRCCFIHTTLPTVALPTNSDRITSLAALSSSSPSSLDVVSLNPPLYLSSSTLNPERASSISPSSQPDGERAPTATTSTGLFGVPFDSLGLNLNVSLKPPGRFTNNPSEVPATYQDPPVSRLQRLANLPKNEMGSVRARERMDEFLNPPLPPSTSFTVSTWERQQGMRRASDGSSVSTTSPALSMMSRSGSNTSISSVDTCGSMPMNEYQYDTALKPVLGDWLGGGGENLDWTDA